MCNHRLCKCSGQLLGREHGEKAIRIWMHLFHKSGLSASHSLFQSLRIYGDEPNRCGPCCCGVYILLWKEERYITKKLNKSGSFRYDEC